MQIVGAIVGIEVDGGWRVGDVVVGIPVGKDELGIIEGPAVVGLELCDGIKVGNRVVGLLVGPGVVGWSDGHDDVGANEGIAVAGGIVGDELDGLVEGVPLVGSGFGAADGRLVPSNDTQSLRPVDQMRLSGQEQVYPTLRFVQANSPHSSRPSLQKFILLHRTPSPV